MNVSVEVILLLYDNRRLFVLSSFVSAVGARSVLLDGSESPVCVGQFRNVFYSDLHDAE